jgi:hypothetical protein
MSTYRITFFGDRKQTTVEAKEHFWDEKIPGVLIVRDEHDNWIYYPVAKYRSVRVDGAGLRMVQAEADNAKTGNEHQNSN